MKITKMHGLGNSQIIVSDLSERLEKEKKLTYSEIAKALSHPGFGIGSDQTLFILPSEKADFKMRVFNRNGEEAEMCGNGIRCVARYLFDRKKVDQNLTIETEAGVKELKIIERDDLPLIEVDMGKGQLLDKNKKVKGFEGSYVSVGNPHFVIFTEEASKDLALSEGSSLETAEEFQPEKANIEFAKLVDKREIVSYVWERGAGLTLACGTGACATAFAAKKRGLTDPVVTVNLLGGNLTIRVNDEDKITMKGPAEYILDGEIRDISKIYDNVSNI